MEYESKVLSHWYPNCMYDPEYPHIDFECELPLTIEDVISEVEKLGYTIRGDDHNITYFKDRLVFCGYVSVEADFNDY